MPAPTDRLAKLRRLADDTRGNPHERELARREAERVEREMPEALRASARAVGFDFEAWMRARDRDGEQRLAEELGPERYAEYRRECDRLRARYQWADEQRRAFGYAERPSAEVRAWMATLGLGDRVRTLHSATLCYEGPPLPSEILTVSRRTPSGIVVMTDGSKWRPDGYKRGETGREGYRTFIVPVEAR
mgnify:CR=1 FL=1